MLTSFAAVDTSPRVCVCRMTPSQTHPASISLVFVEVAGSCTGASDSLAAWEKLQRLRDEGEGGTYVLVSSVVKSATSGTPTAFPWEPMVMPWHAVETTFDAS